MAKYSGLPMTVSRGGPKNSTLATGTLIDRYGKTTGNFLAPVGTPFEQRSLPAISASDTYTTYIVVKPLPVQAGPAASWFGQPGGGLQFKTEMAVQDLIDGGFIERYPR
ncbi:TNT domain-containing protein [Rhizobium sp. 1399]|uniref:TNT domain-containing protein n=1 Tax=Rhizobium sp. 1399 TaxID=2817758 RepID=UPI00285F1156|nr:TNT domain-containing protein [Rhizobium sp. 1399]MDR6671023.1 hypothetical protein [Rhizobium sp. 1399]